MPTVAHSTLTAANLHEPKGAAGASADQAYFSDGAGSGDWEYQEYFIATSIADVSTASTIYIPTPYACTVQEITTVLSGAIASADATITPKNSAGSSMGTITITQSGSAAGDVDTLSPGANNTLTADDYMTIETDGGSTNTVELFITVTLKRTG